MATPVQARRDAALSPVAVGAGIGPMLVAWGFIVLLPVALALAVAGAGLLTWRAFANP